MFYFRVQHATDDIALAGPQVDQAFVLFYRKWNISNRPESNATAPSSITTAARAEIRKSEIIWLSDSGVIASMFSLSERHVSDLWPAGLFDF